MDPSIIEIREFSLENVLNQKFYGQRKEIPREVAIALLVAAGPAGQTDRVLSVSRETWNQTV